MMLDENQHARQHQPAEARPRIPAHAPYMLRPSTKSALAAIGVRDRRAEPDRPFGVVPASAVVGADHPGDQRRLGEIAPLERARPHPVLRFVEIEPDRIVEAAPRCAPPSRAISTTRKASVARSKAARVGGHRRLGLSPCGVLAEGALRARTPTHLCGGQTRLSGVVHMR